MEYFLSNTKIKINSPEESEIVQKFAFSIGYSWECDSKYVKNKHREYLYFYHGYTKMITSSNSDSIFKDHPHKEITFKEIQDYLETMNTKIQEEPEKRQFESGSKRDSDVNKPLPLELNPYMLLRYGYHMKLGQRYGDGNWQLGQPDIEVFRSISRHLVQYQLNKQFPELASHTDDGTDHLSAIIFGINMLMQNEAREGVPADKYFKALREKEVK